MKTFPLAPQGVGAAVCAVLVSLAFAGTARADDEASTSGGLKIKSSDGAFEGSLGGRLQFDAVMLEPDNGSGIGSDKVENNSGSYFRRVYIQLEGRAYDWSYKLHYGVSSGGGGTGSSNSLQDVWLSHSVLVPESTIYIGQHKPWRSIEEIGSNNQALFMERPVTSANGIYGGHDYTQGLYYAYADQTWFGGVSAYLLNRDGTGSSEGTGGNARLVWSPINDSGRLLHLGLSYSSDHADNTANASQALSASYRYGGYRLGSGSVTQTFASYGAGPSPSQDTIGAEFAGVYGPAYLNAEFASAKFEQDGKPSSTVDAAYVQASWFLTGESKAYSIKEHVIGNPKPKNRNGAIELKLRYEMMRNTDVDASQSLGCNITQGPSTGVDDCRYSGWTTGVNYYPNPAMRIMLDYMRSTADLGSAGKDEPDTIAARVQIVY
ncbi:MAG: porin [Hydrocarboniphaga sp.]|uniref:OprO/OprP family phosphate-selective porin n=1 Tax=Hydrocarboniphaga sp. TaxID=2033016 RepID=UPI0026221E93|nr:porin [Hydrocarboniphaga sp.]MDB5972672.1 porin [Hydrocarboniphaga sp.]